MILLKQKINSFDLSTTKEKFKVITNLIFSKTLKKLKFYLNMTKYLREYIFYCAQKSDSLNKRKINLLKTNSEKSSAQKSFTIRTLLKNFNQNEINFYD